MARPDLRALSARITEGEAQSVIDELAEAWEAEPSHVACLVVLARALEATGDPVEALKKWRSAYALCPDSPVVRDELRRASAALACEAARDVRQSRATDAAEKSLHDDEPYHELDDLIRELESARIVPDPQVQPVEPGRLNVDVDDVVSETLAKIYANQRFFDEAAGVYDKLADQQPERRSEFSEKAAEIRKRVAK
ncbi:MAG: tetratricopeptide (TPR) repeat protein [Rhodothermales bacterium]|jgi:tetratricopeptide (TPR) repeat protein